MSKHILFCIHGMGEHDDTWQQKGIQVLKSAFGDFDRTSQLDFDTTFTVVPIVYNDVFKETRERANADFAAFRGAVLADLDTADDASKDVVGRQLDKYSELLGTGDDNFVWTHILDVILYRFSKTIRAGIDVSVAEQIIRALKEIDHKTWSVLAHSLGTSVAHNTINSLHNTGFPNAPNGPLVPLNPLESRCNTLMMIANVSRVMQRTGAKVYETNVKPGSATAGRLCSWYLSARHKLDPITIVKPFNPDLWPDTATFSTKRYQMLRPAHIHFESDAPPRVHDFDHYLLNPRVHVPLFRSILGERLIGDDEFGPAKAQFDSEIASNTLDQARAMLENRLPATSGGWTNLLAAIKRLLS